MRTEHLDNLGSHERDTLLTIEALGGKVTNLVGPSPKVRVTWPKPNQKYLKFL